MSDIKTVKNLSTEESDWEINSSSESSNDEDEDNEVPQQTVFLKKTFTTETANQKQTLDNTTNKTIDKSDVTSKKLDSVKDISNQTLITENNPSDKKDETNHVLKYEMDEKTKSNREVQVTTTIKKIKKAPKRSDSGNNSSTSVDKDSEDHGVQGESNAKPKKKSKLIKSKDKPEEKVEKVKEKKTVKKVKQIKNVLENDESASSDNVKVVEGKDNKTKITKKKSAKIDEQTDKVNKPKKSSKKSENAEFSGEKKVKVKGKKSESTKTIPSEPKNKDENIKVKTIKPKMNNEKSLKSLNSESNDKSEIETLNKTALEDTKNDAIKVVNGVSENIEKCSNLTSSPDLETFSQNNKYSSSDEANSEAKIVIPLKTLCQENGESSKIMEGDCHLVISDVYSKKETKENDVDDKLPNANDKKMSLETDLDEWMKDLLARHNIKREVLSPTRHNIKREVLSPTYTQSFGNDESIGSNDTKVEESTEQSEINSNGFLKDKSTKYDDSFRNENTFDDTMISHITKTNLENHDRKQFSQKLVDKEIQGRMFETKTRTKNEQDEEINEHKQKRYEHFLSIGADEEIDDLKTKRQNDDQKKRLKQILSDDIDDIINKMTENSYCIQKDNEYEANNEEESFMTRFRREKYSKVLSKRNKLEQPKCREGLDEKIKEKYKHVRVLVEKQQSVVDNLKTLSKKLSELESMVEEAESESQDQKAVFENLETSLDSAYSQYESDLREATEQTSRQKKFQSENFQDEINTIFNNTLLFTKNQSFKLDSNKEIKKSFQSNQITNLVADERNSPSTKSPFGIIWDFNGDINKSKMNYNGENEKVMYNPIKKKFQNDFENIVDVKNKSLKNETEDNSELSANDFINKIRNKYAIQPLATPTKNNYNYNTSIRNSPYNRSSISDFSLLENKYGKCNTDSNRQGFERIVNKRHSLTKNYDDDTNSIRSYSSLSNKYLNEKSFSTIRPTEVQAKYDKYNAPTYQSKFLRSMLNDSVN
ncbi:hypothetical protein HELRODRAFT_168157 [Helobdella robusta]|uniref:Uncharacterized protein n=1 Tax=Helobdella robusta TaxID=6412 RepID=T1F086_HELRO|nr:hypothetical protein HELRODRAFT_168157 [Helobdella robusta]ESO09198.1 hypothetical protein HELRODRAFT_168157 [Helobdella robusta]